MENWGNLTTEFNTSNLSYNFLHRKQNSFDQIVANFPGWLLNVQKETTAWSMKKPLKHI